MVIHCLLGYANTILAPIAYSKLTNHFKLISHKQLLGEQYTQMTEQYKIRQHEFQLQHM
jgi:hypothetical protein